MHQLSSQQLLTCRYWAFGPGCPDISASNVQSCRYAHWDTGRLADFYAQRGTCYEWFNKRSCPFGASCSYEHRETGVMGLHRGMLVLHGLDLEIADAANKSGFNTRNQVALMDLIWSVRRIAFRHAVERPRIERPPKHPVYPDRYRPGDPSDNTQRPRKRAREWEERRSWAGAGTVNSPIDLDGDGLEANGGGTVANSAAKRLKVAGGQIGRHTFQLPERPKIRNPVHPSKFSTSTSNRAEHGSTGAAGTTSMRSSGSLKHPRPRPLSASPIFHNRRALTATAQDMTVVELRKVGNTLKDNIDAVVKCGHVMRGLYDRDDRLGDGVIYKELERLKEVFDNSLRDAGAGIKYVHRVMSLLEDDRDRVIKLVDGKL